MFDSIVKLFAFGFNFYGIFLIP